MSDIETENHMSIYLGKNMVVFQGRDGNDESSKTVFAISMRTASSWVQDAWKRNLTGLQAGYEPH